MFLERYTKVDKQLLEQYLQLNNKTLESVLTTINQIEEYIKNIQKEEILKEIYELIAEGNDRISGNEPEGYLLLGNTGTGKSTLANLFIKQELFSVYDEIEGRMIVQLAQHPETIKINHTKASETKVPNKTGIIDKFKTTNNIVVWDCPGFQDTRLIQEIVNSFYIKKLFSQHQKLKFVLVATDASITHEKGTSFVNNLKLFCNSFKDISLVKDSVILIVTTTPARKKVENIENALKSIKEQNDTLTEEHKKMIDCFLTDQKIAVFYEPTKEDKLPPEAYDLFNQVSKMGSFVDIKTDIGKFSLSEEAKEYCKDLYKTSFSNLEKLIGFVQHALNQPQLCLKSGQNSAFETNYNTIKNWLPNKATYLREEEPKVHTSGEYFLPAKQLIKLKNLLKMVNDNPQSFQDLDKTVNLLEKLLNIFEEYVIIDPYYPKESGTLEFKVKIEHFAYAARQMKEYCKLFASFIDNQFEQGFEIANLATQIVNLFNNSNGSLETKLKQAILNLKIDDNSTDTEYNKEAIKLLNLYGNEEQCTKKKAMSYNYIGYAKKEEGKLEEAVKYYKQAIKLDKTLNEAYENLAEILYGQKNYKEAVGLYRITKNVDQLNQCHKNLIQSDLKDYKLRKEAGDTWKELGLFHKAQKYYLQAHNLTKDVQILKGLSQEIANCLKNQVHTDMSNNYQKAFNTGIFYDYGKFDPNCLQLDFSEVELVGNMEIN